MSSPFLALTWEIWAQSRKLVWAVVGIISCCALTSHIVPNKQYVLQSFQAVYWLLMICSLFLTFGIFHHAEYNPGKSWHGFPYRLFSLPVPTVVLILCPMTLGVLSAEVVYWAWAKLVFAPLGRVVSFWPAACVGAGMVCYQAIIWGLAGFRITRIVVLAVAGLVFVDLGMLPLLQEIRVWPEQQIFAVGVWLLACFSIGAFFGAWLCVERQRRGGGRGRGWLKARVTQFMDMLPRRTKGFASPAAAQFWFEWRRAGLMLPVCCCFLLVLVVLPLSWFTRANLDSLLLTLGWAVLLPPILATVIGKGFAKPDFWSSNLSLPSFLAIRPFASGDMVVTKLKVAALSVAITWAIVAGFLSCYLPLWAPANQIHEVWQPLGLIYQSSELYGIITLAFFAGVLLTWRMMIQGLWVGLSGNQKFFIGSAVGQVIVAGFLVWGVVWLERLFWTHLNQAIHNLRWIGWGLITMITLKLSLSMFSWNRISSSRARKYLVLWWLATLALVALVLLINPAITSLKHVLILVVFLPVPLARLGLAPLALTKNRHR